MGGYRDAIITLKFPELVEDGDTCHVIIRNPRTMPGSEFKAMASGADENADSGETMDRMFAMIARLVVGWRVWDPTVPLKVNPDTGALIHDEETEPRLLPLPATAELVAKLPQVISMKLMDEVGSAVNPKTSPADSTSTTS